MRWLVFIVAVWLMPSEARAQWAGAQDDSGALVRGDAVLQGAGLGFSCTAPSPQGLGLMDTGEHESHRTEAFQFYISMFDPFFDWQAAVNYQIEGAMIQIGTQGFVLPPVRLNELQGVAVHLPMTDPMIEALSSAQEFFFHNGQGKVWQYPAAGLGAALETAFTPCVQRWAQLGHSVPPALSSNVPTPAPAPSTAPLMQQMIANVERACEGPAVIDGGFLLQQDINQDGTLDMILDWGGVSCQSPKFAGLRGGGQCGMENCLIEFYVSGVYQSGAEPFGILAMGLTPVQGSPRDVQLGGASHLCRQLGRPLGCTTLHRWQNGGLRRLN